jgi:hypothetical protein
MPNHSNKIWELKALLEQFIQEEELKSKLPILLMLNEAQLLNYIQNDNGTTNDDDLKTNLNTILNWCSQHGINSTQEKYYVAYLVCYEKYKELNPEWLLEEKQAVFQKLKDLHKSYSEPGSILKALAPFASPLEAIGESRGESRQSIGFRAAMYLSVLSAALLLYGTNYFFGDDYKDEKEIARKLILIIGLGFPLVCWLAHAGDVFKFFHNKNNDSPYLQPPTEAAISPSISKKEL